MTRATPSRADATGLRARDVVAFGSEVGRILSDGRIVGRAEPFAKVFPSSPQVKRAVGAVAWVILEDIALDATIDPHGRLVADTSVRRIADHLGVNKNTVARHLSRLRDHGFVLHEETRDRGSGRWDTNRYILDPSACVERFTHTPPADRPDQRRSRDGDAAAGGKVTVSAFTGHGDTGSRDATSTSRHRHATPEEQHADNDGPLTRRLRAAGVAGRVAADLVARYPAQHISDALDVLPARETTNAPGWLVRAISDAWPLHAEADRIRAARAQAEQQRTAQQAARARQEHRDRRLAGWAAATSDALTDTQLMTAVERITRPVEGLDRRSAPVAASQLVTWAITTASTQEDAPLHVALDHALREHTTASDSTAITVPDDIPEPPATTQAAADPDAFRRRVSTAIKVLEGPHPTLQPKQEGASDER